jgi:hypothetical protein
MDPKSSPDVASNIPKGLMTAVIKSVSTTVVPGRAHSLDHSLTHAWRGHPHRRLCCLPPRRAPSRSTSSLEEQYTHSITLSLSHAHTHTYNTPTEAPRPTATSTAHARTHAGSVVCPPGELQADLPAVRPTGGAARAGEALNGRVRARGTRGLHGVAWGCSSPY